MVIDDSTPGVQYTVPTEFKFNCPGRKHTMRIYTMARGGPKY